MSATAEELELREFLDSLSRPDELCEELEKGRPHKYIYKMPDGKGGFIYFYSWEELRAYRERGIKPKQKAGKHVSEDKLLASRVVARISGGMIKPKEGQKPVGAAMEWVTNNIKKPIKTVIGDVIVNARGMKNSLSHGFSWLKLDVIPAIPAVLHNGVYLGKLSDFSGGTIMNHYFAGKIRSNGKKRLLFCRVRDAAGDPSGKRFYVHEVFTWDEIKNGVAAQKYSPSDERVHTGRSLFLLIIQDFLDIKRKMGKNK